jgi:adenylate kinase
VNIILFGPPGAGKGTQARFIVKNYNYFQLSTGDILRNEITNKTSIGKKIEITISKGDFVPDELVNKLLEQTISNLKYRDRIIFDGYPRNIFQADNLNNILKKFKQEIGAIIYLNTSREIIEKRIMGRMTCEKCNMTLNKFFNKEAIELHPCGKVYLKKRNDDNYETILSRYDSYMLKTKPALDFYSKKDNFYEIDGSLKIEEIISKIDQILKV